MPLKLQSLYLYIFLALAIVGCRGCSCSPPTTYILESLVEEIRFDENNTAKIQIEHLKKKGMGFTFKFKKHGGNATYAIRYNLQFNDRPYRKAIFEHDAVKTDSMSQHKGDISVTLSDDKQHLLISYLGKPIDVYHLLSTGTPFSTSFKKQELKASIAAFKQKELKTPINIMTDYVARMETTESYNNNPSIKETLDAQEGMSLLDHQLLELIGKPLADYYFEKEGRVHHLCIKDKKWRTRATKKVYRFVGEASQAKQPFSKEMEQNIMGAVHLFTHGLSKHIDKRAIERMVLPQYPLYPYTLPIYALEEHRSLRKNEAQSIEKNCKKLLTNDEFRQTLPNEQSAANAAIEFLIQYRDPQNSRAFHQIISFIFRKEILALDPPNLEHEILFPYTTRFSHAEQEIILARAKDVAKKGSKDEQNFHLKSFLKRIEMEESTPNIPS